MSTTVKGLEWLRTFLQERRQILVVTHNDPDPDALAAAYGMSTLLRVYRRRGQRIVPAFGGLLARAENREMVRALRLRFRHVERLNLNEFDGIVLVDTQPGVGNHALPEDCVPEVVIDHHPRLRSTGQAMWADVRPSYGATSTIVAEYLMAANVPWDERVATALFYGIRTDTLGLARGATEHDAAMYLALHAHVNQQALARIERAPLPRRYFRALAKALEQATIYHNVVFLDLGQMDRPDLGAEMADLFLRLERTEWVISVGIYDDMLIVSVRTNSPTPRAGHLVRRAVGRRGRAGGHGTMAAGRIVLDHRNPEEESRRLRHRFLELLGLADVRGRPLLAR
ncbi:MAG: DHH family phosphoesterase [Ardenticatenia bacterium]|nr:DHH family phosphoesterase [Ardenticatenia bacterium]